MLSICSKERVDKEEEARGACEERCETDLEEALDAGAREEEEEFVLFGVEFGFFEGDIDVFVVAFLEGAAAAFFDEDEEEGVEDDDMAEDEEGFCEKY